MSGSKSNYLEMKILDHMLGTTPFAMPGGLVLALFTSDPTEGDAAGAAGGVEVAGPVGTTGYERKAITFKPAADAGAGVMTAKNVAALTFGPAAVGVNWGSMSHFGIFDSVGILLFSGSFAAAKPVNGGDTFSVPIDGITVTED
jgi:hypothetical protein